MNSKYSYRLKWYKFTSSPTSMSARIFGLHDNTPSTVSIRQTQRI